MLCIYLDPVWHEKGKIARAQAYKNATSEDEQLAAAESTWEDYVPICTCDSCTQAALEEFSALEIDEDEI